MGITNFLQWLDNFKGRNKYRLKNLPYNIANLYIDTNGILHKAAQIIYHYGGKKKEEKEEQKKLRVQDYSKSDEELLKAYVFQIYKQMNEILKRIRPTDNMFICPDGVAPKNKLKQQKERRYRAEAQKAGNEVDKKSEVRFNPSVITPGTDLTIFIEQKLEDWILQTRQRTSDLLPKRVLYSGFFVNGEGEHKIFKYIRDGLVINGSNTGIKNSVIYGLDADLVILSVLSGIKNLYLVRENFTDVIFIDELRNSIYETLKFEGCINDVLLKDFSILVSFAGNDFLPKFPFFTDTNEMITFTFECYMKIKCHITKENGHIDYKNFLKLLKEMEKRQIKYYQAIYEGEVRGMHPYKEITNNSLLFGKGEDLEYALNINRMKNAWYLHEFKPATTTLQLYFEDMASDTSGIEHSIPNYMHIKDNPYFEVSDVENMVIDFLRTMEWSLLYYTKGEDYINKDFFYKYLRAPMLEDCILVLERLNDKRIDIDFSHIIVDKSREITTTPIHQLLMVIPPDSISLISKKFHPIYKEMSCINPDYYDISMEGCSKDWQGHPIIPDISPKIASFLLRQTKLTKYYEKDYKIFDKLFDYVDLHERNQTFKSKKTFEPRLEIRNDLEDLINEDKILSSKSKKKSRRDDLDEILEELNEDDFDINESEDDETKKFITESPKKDFEKNERSKKISLKVKENVKALSNKSERHFFNPHIFQGELM